MFLLSVIERAKGGEDMDADCRGQPGGAHRFRRTRRWLRMMDANRAASVRVAKLNGKWISYLRETEGVPNCVCYQLLHFPSRQ